MKRLNYNYYCISEKGKRSNNQDAVLTLRIDDDSYFFAVADGMGGVKGGEIASNLVVQKVHEFLEERSAKSGLRTDNLKETLKDVFELAQEEIRKLIAHQPSLKGLGTTLTAILVHKDNYVWGNLGDSRFYQIKDNGVVRLTRDHTLMEDSNQQGHDLSVMPQHYKHVLTRVIDGEDSQADIYPADDDYLVARHDTTWILCSDGLIVEKKRDYNNVLLNYIGGFRDPEDIARALVQNALESGSSDNISVVVIKVSDPDVISPDEATTQKMIMPVQPESNKVSKKGKGWLLWSMIIIIVLLVSVGWIVNAWNIRDFYGLRQNQRFSAQTIAQVVEAWYQQRMPVFELPPCVEQHRAGAGYFQAASIKISQMDTAFFLHVSENKLPVVPDQNGTFLSSVFPKSLSINRYLNDSTRMVIKFNTQYTNKENTDEWIEAAGLVLLHEYLCLSKHLVNESDKHFNIEEIKKEIQEKTAFATGVVKAGE